ncbi:MAG TPA: type III-A CRISPR-associated RAMP protein Csm3 [Eubacteriaceae bacterium]|jgi:CRISPR-associated protein Csm3|nr:type III-A CRISPR-associated RAMP protein Csm3 [Eubacteriaceae bacterium]
MAYGKILIKGEIEVVTGLHIGGTGSYSAIGAVDSPVIRDSISGNPIIPGSSLKGKMRALIQKSIAASSSHNNDPKEVLRLFGSSNDGKDKPSLPSRLTFRDCFIKNEKLEELRKANIRLTEVKTENTIDRKTSIANPRQIERVIRGLVFDFEMIYDVLEGKEEELEEDFKNISKAMILLENDYLGGHGSRGSGRIKFNNLVTKYIYGNGPEVKLEV